MRITIYARLISIKHSHNTKTTTMGKKTTLPVMYMPYKDMVKLNKECNIPQSIKDSIFKENKGILPDCAINSLYNTIAEMGARIAIEHQSEAHSSQWVKVSDSKKPEWDEAVLTVDGYGYMTVCGYDQTIGFYPKLSGDHPNWDNTILTHWKSLPHPPKEDNRDGV